MANPTMTKSRKVESEVDAKNLALIQQLNELEHIWKSQERSRPRYLRSCSTASDNTITSFDHLFQNSPRALMSSLQHRKPAFLRVKNCSSAVEEILMDRRATIMSGRFKGRQLFPAAEESGGEICSDWVNGVQEREVIVDLHDGGGERRGDSCDFSESCSFAEEKTVVEVAVVAEKRGGDRRRKEKVGGRRAATASLGVALIVLALVLFCMSCNGNNVELMLVPT